MKRYTLAALAALLVIAPWHQTVRATAPLYTVLDLGNFGGQVPTISGINASGQVVGNVAGAAGSQAVRYTDGLGWQALPGLDTSFSVAAGINAAGDVVGYYFNAAGDLRGYRYRDATGVEDIAPLPGGSITLAFAINAAGTVVGYGDSPTGMQAFRAEPGMAPVALPSLGGGFSLACGINDLGQVAGASVTPSGAQHAMRVDPGASSAVDIQSLDGPDAYSSVCAIDADGRVGGAADHLGALRAFRHSDAAGGLDLDSFGSIGSNVDSIAAGLSVGWYTVEDGTTRAFAHNDEGGSVDLNTRISDAGWLLSAARSVNVNGVIAGEGFLNGAPAAFLLTPVAVDSTPPVVDSISATPSLISPPAGQTVEVTLTVSATDDSGQAPTCSLESITGPGAPGDVAVTGQFTGTVLAVAGRVYSLNAVCVDAAGNSANASADVTVANDTTAPVIASVAASPSSIFPADGRMVPVAISVVADDDVDAAPVCSVTGVTGGVAGSATVTGPLSVSVKAKASTVYTVAVQCADAAGNVSNGATAVTVATPGDTKKPSIWFLKAKRTDIRVAGVPWESVKVYVLAVDNVDRHPTCSITSITGAPAGSFAITGRLTAKVRALRSAGDLRRTYVLNVTCVDDAGNAATASVNVKPDGPTWFSGGHRWRW